MRVLLSSDPLLVAPLETRNFEFLKCRDFNQSAQHSKIETTMPKPRKLYLVGEYDGGSYERKKSSFVKRARASIGAGTTGSP